MDQRLGACLKIQFWSHGPLACATRRPAVWNGKRNKRGLLSLSLAHRSVPVSESPTGTGGSPVPTHVETGSQPLTEPACWSHGFVIRAALGESVVNCSATE